MERIFKTALHIIYQEEYISFDRSRKRTKLKTLAERRKDVIFKFSKSEEKLVNFKDWFSEQDPPARKTRTFKKEKYKPVPCRTKRFARSAIPVLTKAVSWHPPMVYVAPDVH